MNNLFHPAVTWYNTVSKAHADTRGINSLPYRLFWAGTSTSLRQRCKMLLPWLFSQDAVHRHYCRFLDRLLRKRLSVAAIVGYNEDQLQRLFEITTIPCCSDCVVLLFLLPSFSCLWHHRGQVGMGPTIQDTAQSQTDGVYADALCGCHFV